VHKFDIRAITENCTGCMRCQLACSELHTRKFNLHGARIKVNLSGTECTIEFGEDCTGCGVCADNCLYDALLKTRRGSAQ
jgi:Fe-S-cluster-containing hydrogenase component 2